MSGTTRLIAGLLECGMEEPSNTLAGKSALITGAAHRLGRAVALALAGRGAGVAIHYHASQRGAAELAATIESRGLKACTVGADLSDPNQAADLVDRASALMGPLDILINNASVFTADRLRTVTIDRIVANVQINALAPFQLARSFAGQGRTGAIVNFLDCRMVDYDADHAAYHLSKRMLYSLTRMMAVEFAPAVTVNAVAPGLILPPAGKDVTYLERLAHTNLLNRYGSVDDVVRAVLFLLDSPFITGQVIFIDGGRSLRGCMYG